MVFRVEKVSSGRGSVHNFVALNRGAIAVTSLNTAMGSVRMPACAVVNVRKETSKAQRRCENNIP